MHVKHLVYQMLSLAEDPAYHRLVLVLLPTSVFHPHTSPEKLLLLKLTNPWEKGVLGHFWAPSKNVQNVCATQFVKSLIAG